MTRGGRLLSGDISGSIVDYVAAFEGIADVGSGAGLLGGPDAEALGPVAARVLAPVEVEDRRVLAVDDRVGVLAHDAVVVVIDGDGIVAHAVALDYV